MVRAFRIAVAAWAALVLVAGAATDAEAKKAGKGSSRSSSESGDWLRYSVPFTCGLNGGDIDRVVPGTYAAAVNILNPAGGPAMLELQVALTFPPDLPEAGDVSDPVASLLGAGAALQVDCGEILGGGFVFPGGPPASPYVQGFLVILAYGPLEVSLTQTATGASGEVSMTLQRVAGVRVEDMDDEDDDHKVEICHVPPGNPANAHTLEVDMSAIPAHLGHGDGLGECDDDDEEEEDEFEDELED